MVDVRIERSAISPQREFRCLGGGKTSSAETCTEQTKMLLTLLGFLWALVVVAGRFSLPVLEACCSYQRPARYDEELEVTVAGQLLSAVRVRFEYEIVRATDRTAVATGNTVHATIDRAGRPCRLPDRVRGLFGAPASAQRLEEH